MMKKLLLLVSLTIALCACSVSPDDIKYNGISNVKIEAFTNSQVRMKLTADIENSSHRTITIKNGRLSLNDGVNEIAQITTSQPIVIPKKFIGDIEMPVDIKSKGILGFMALAKYMSKANMSTLSVSGEVRVSCGLYSKKIEMENMPLMDFLNLMGVDDFKSLNLPF